MFDISLPTDRSATAGDGRQVGVVVNHLVGMGLKTRLVWEIQAGNKTGGSTGHLRHRRSDGDLRLRGSGIEGRWRSH